MSRNAKNRMHEGKAQLHSVQMQLQNQIGEPGPCLFVYFSVVNLFNVKVMVVSPFGRRYEFRRAQQLLPPVQMQLQRHRATRQRLML